MAAASRRKSLLQRPAPRAGDGAVARGEPPGDDPAPNSLDPDLLAALDDEPDELEPDLTASDELALDDEDLRDDELQGDGQVEAGDVDEEGLAATLTGAAVRTMAPGQAQVTVKETQAAGSGFRAESNDDMWCTDEPNSEEVRLDPRFARLSFRTPPPAPAVEPPPQPIAPRPPSRPPASEGVRTRHGAVDEVANRPGGSNRTATPTPVRRAVTAPPPPVEVPYTSAPPQPQAAQGRPRAAEVRAAEVRAEPPADAPRAERARLNADMFGTPIPTGRVVAPEGGWQSKAERAPAPSPVEPPVRGDDPQVPAAGVLAVGGAAMVALGVAAVLLLGAIGLSGYYLLAGGAAPVEAPPVEQPTPREAEEPAPPPEPEAPTDAADAATPADPASPAQPEAAPRPRGRPRAPEPPPPEPTPAPPPVAAPAPAPPPPPPPAPAADEDDKKGKKRKKK